MSPPIPPTVTPPAHVRTVTLEELALEVGELKRARLADYTVIRDLKSLVETNHLALMHEIGQLAKAISKGRKR